MVNARTVIACICLFFFLMMALTNFNFFPYRGNWVAYTQTTSAGDSKRQIIYTIMVIVALWFSLPTFSYTYRTTYHLKAIALVTFWAILSVSWSAVPDIAARRLVLYIMVLIVVISFTSNFHTTTFVKVLLCATGFILINNYLGIVFLRELSVFEDQGRGATWRGLHSHKNTAGHTNATTTIIWFWASFMFKPRFFFLFVAAASAVFTYQSQSKSAWGALFVILIVSYMFATFCRQPRAMAKIILTLFLSLSFLLIVLTFLSTNDLVQTTTGDSTLTGRTELWGLVLEYIYESPIVGMGFESFWLIGENASALTGIGGWVDHVFQAHNGYLDVVLTLGVVGLAALLLFLAAPILDSTKLKDSPFAIVAIFYSLWAYGVFVNVVESSLLKKDHYIWTLVMVGVFGLRQLVSEAHGDALSKALTQRSSRV